MDGFLVTLPEAVCLGASLTLSCIFYYMHKQSRKTLSKLEDAPHFILDGKLKNLLRVTPGASLHYAVIEGTVKPSGEPLTSQFHKEVPGVVQKYILKEQRLVWSSMSQTWMETERVLHQRVNMVPFMLVGSDETEVKILSPLQASGEHTVTIYEKFHQPSHTLGEMVGQFIVGEKSKGLLEIEEMLKVGTTLTGIGELTLHTDGTLSLRPPSDSLPYFLSMADFDTLRRENDSTVFWWKALTVASALAGATVLFWVGLRYYRQLKSRWEKEREAKEFARLTAEAEASQDGAENRMQSCCVICLSQPRECILLDCGHVCSCYRCYQALPQNKCPICRQDIVRVLPFYHP